MLLGSLHVADGELVDNVVDGKQVVAWYVVLVVFCDLRAEFRVSGEVISPPAGANQYTQPADVLACPDELLECRAVERGHAYLLSLVDNVCAVVADEVQAGAVFLGEQVCNRVEGASACHCEFNSAALQLVEYLEEIPGEFFPVVEQGAVHVACDELYHMYISSLLFCLFFFYGFAPLYCIIAYIPRCCK